MTERLMGDSLVIQARVDRVMPLCPNNAPGEGNCPGMVKYGTCPMTRGGKGKFSDCRKYVDESFSRSKFST